MTAVQARGKDEAWFPLSSHKARVLVIRPPYLPSVALSFIFLQIRANDEINSNKYIISSFCFFCPTPGLWKMFHMSFHVENTNLTM